MSSVELVKRREEEAAKLISILSKKSSSFAEPKIVLIGGYALRAFLPFSRYSRDCDFVLKEGLKTVKEWVTNDITLETFESKENYGYMRWVKVFDVGKKRVKFGVDFMERQVVGRKGEAFTIDGRFLDYSRRVKINFGESGFEVFVPSYEDFFIIKVMAARESDIRDIAALVWKNGIPVIKDRLIALSDPGIFKRNLNEKVIPEIEYKLFLNSWRGVFKIPEFTEKDKVRVIEELKNIV